MMKTTGKETIGMTLGDKLTALRKENQYTQEQLADLLGVSRQSVSKWESNLAYPETEKLIKLGELYRCSMDYLLKDEQETPSPQPKSWTLTLDLNTMHFERKSRRQIHGLPLWHINIGFGRQAKGVIAIGFRAKGILSIGLFSLGLVSIGLCSIGGLAVGVLALGLLSAGVLAIGILACGAICLGVVSIGAIAIGHFSVGALAIGQYFAWGDHAEAMVALGDTHAVGRVYQKIGELTAQDIAAVREMLDAHVPPYWSWAKEIIQHFL